jgi:hypothetical protein
MFFEHCIVVFFERTNPASSMQKPAAIHMTRKPCIRNDKVLKMYAVSGETAADAAPLMLIVDNPTVKQNSA